MAHDPVAMIAALIDGKGERQYGLGSVNQRAHALQAALLAEQSGCDSALITAALLHDIGHMVHDLGEDPAADGVDDLHEERGHAFLAQYFGPEGDRACAAACRRQTLSVRDGSQIISTRLTADSVRSLTLQGGPMSAEEVDAFAAQPQGKAAVQLRRFDEAAKVKGLPTPPVEHFLPHTGVFAVRACLR